MIVLLSPSKSMNMEPAKIANFTQPEFLDQSKILASAVRKFSTPELMKFMGISEKLAELNRQRFIDWNPPFSTQNAKQAMLAFTGNVYDGIDFNSLNQPDISFAQQHLRILSGLYGLLKPLDLIQPYRLEMGRPLKTHGARNLYEFWRNILTETLNKTPGNLLINLSSAEYFKAIAPRALNKQIVSPVFKDEKNGTFKIISFYAKKARGSMARYIIKNHVNESADLREFAEDGYTYAPELSMPETPVFTRPER